MPLNSTTSTGRDHRCSTDGLTRRHGTITPRRAASGLVRWRRDGEGDRPTASAAPTSRPRSLGSDPRHTRRPTLAGRCRRNRHGSDRLRQRCTDQRRSRPRHCRRSAPPELACQSRSSNTIRSPGSVSMAYPPTGPSAGRPLGESTGTARWDPGSIRRAPLRPSNGSR